MVKDHTGRRPGQKHARVVRKMRLRRQQRQTTGSEVDVEMISMREVVSLPAVTAVPVQTLTRVPELTKVELEEFLDDVARTLPDYEAVKATVAAIMAEVAESDAVKKSELPAKKAPEVAAPAPKIAAADKPVVVNATPVAELKAVNVPVAVAPAPVVDVVRGSAAPTATSNVTVGYIQCSDDFPLASAPFTVVGVPCGYVDTSNCIRVVGVPVQTAKLEVPKAAADVKKPEAVLKEVAAPAPPKEAVAPVAAKKEVVAVSAAAEVSDDTKENVVPSTPAKNSEVLKVVEAEISVPAGKLEDAATRGQTADLGTAASKKPQTPKVIRAPVEKAQVVLAEAAAAKDAVVVLDAAPDAKKPKVLDAAVEVAPKHVAKVVKKPSPEVFEVIHTPPTSDDFVKPAEQPVKPKDDMDRTQKTDEDTDQYLKDLFTPSIDTLSTTISQYGISAKRCGHCKVVLLDTESMSKLRSLFHSDSDATLNNVSSISDTSIGLRSLFNEAKPLLEVESSHTCDLYTLRSVKSNTGAVSSLGLRSLFEDAKSTASETSTVSISNLFNELTSSKSDTATSSILAGLFDSNTNVKTADIGDKERRKAMIAKDLAQYMNSDDERTAPKSSSLSTFVGQIEALFERYRVALNVIDKLEAEIAALKKA